MKFRPTMVLAAALFGQAGGAATPVEEAHALARSMFKELIEIDTSGDRGSTVAANALAQRLRAAGFPAADIQVLGPAPHKQNVVVRLRGNGKKQPVLLLGHLDVVTALRSDWTVDPYQFIEKDGYFYGRGTQDMKDGVAIMMTTLIRYRQEGLRPDRDIILALTADEESGTANGVEWLLKNHRELVDAEFALSHDGGGVTLERGKPVLVEVGASEKLYADFALVTRNPGGHSSLPVRDNAIYSLADAVQRIGKFTFPFELNNVTRAYFEAMKTRAAAQRAADLQGILATPPNPGAMARVSSDTIDNSITHTTCVATRLEGGHANNALPQMARATVNCRILPGYSAEEVRRTLVQVVGNPAVEVQYVNIDGSLAPEAPPTKALAPPPPRDDVVRPLERIAKKMWPSAPVVPTLSAGTSDAVYTSTAGLPTYSISGEAIERDDMRAHGQDERILARSFYRAVDFYYEYLRAVVTYK